MTRSEPNCLPARSTASKMPPEITAKRSPERMGIGRAISTSKSLMIPNGGASDSTMSYVSRAVSHRSRGGLGVGL